MTARIIRSGRCESLAGGVEDCDVSLASKRGAQFFACRRREKTVALFKMKSIATLLLLIPTAQAAFIPSGVPVAWGSGTKLGFGFPSGFGGSKADDNKADAEENAPEKKISAGGLVQLITAGMGAPFLGDFEGVDEVSRID